MSAPIILVAQERANGHQRLSFTWGSYDDGGERLRIAIERAQNGEWVTAHYVDLTPAEVFRAHDAVGLALHYAWRAKR